VSLDGAAKDGTNHATAGPVSTVPNTLAAGYDPHAVGGWFPGDIDSLVFYSKVLSDAEIALLYNGGLGLAYYDLALPVNASLLSGLVAFYDCDDTAGNNLADAHTGGHTLLGLNGVST